MRGSVSRHVFWAGLAVAVLLAGCCSVETADIPADGKTYRTIDGSRPLAHAVASNYGWYLFNTCPIVTGNADVDSPVPWSFFSDDVRFDVLQEHLVKLAQTRHAQLHEINLTRNESIFFDIPGLGIPLPIPYLICYHEKQISAILAEDAPQTAEEANARAVARLLDELNDGESRK